MSEFITIWHSAEQPLSKLLQEASGLTERARLVELMRRVKLADAKLRGLSRRQMPRAEGWLAAAQVLTELAERAPRQVVPALRHAFDGCVERAEALDRQGKTAEPWRLAKSLYDAGRTPDIQAFGFLAKAEAGDRPVVSGTASSSIEDLEGDIIDGAALAQLEAGLPGLTVFLNHRYSWPEDVFGTVLSAKLVKQGDEATVRVSVAVEDKNPRALQSYTMIKNGTRAGFSIGILVRDYREIKSRKGVRITDLLPLELSLCGIPANPLSWVQMAARAVKGQAKPGSKAAALIGLKRWKESQANK